MKRSTFIKSIGLLPLIPTSMQLEQLRSIADSFAPTERMPVLFIGHGNPMNALLDNAFTQELVRTGVTIRKKYKPNVILVVSAHWLTKGTFVCANPKPETIHDFGGFPDELFAVQYPAVGSPEYAVKTAELSSEIHITNEWGLDHGAWSILRHLVPAADIPVFQVSIDYHRPMHYHFDLAKQLQALRHKGVLIIGSGNIVHNLRLSMENMRSGSNKPYGWAIEFDDWAKKRLDDRDFQALVNFEKMGTSAKLSVPTVDHYVPMLYSVGLATAKEEIHQFYEEIDLGGISMRCFQVG